MNPVRPFTGRTLSVSHIEELRRYTERNRMIPCDGQAMDVGPGGSFARTRRVQPGVGNAGLDLSVFAFGYAGPKYESAKAYAMINAGSIHHGLNHFDAAAAEVEIAGGTEGNPNWIYVEYRIGIDATIITTSSPTRPPSEAAVLRIPLIRLYLSSAGRIVGPAKGHVKQLGDICDLISFP